MTLFNAASKSLPLRWRRRRLVLRRRRFVLRRRRFVRRRLVRLPPFNIPKPPTVDRGLFKNLFCLVLWQFEIEYVLLFLN